MELRKRLSSAAVMIAVVVCALLFLRGIWFSAFIVAISLLIAFDVLNVMKKGGYKPYDVLLYACVVLVWPAFHFFGYVGLFGLLVLGEASFMIAAIFARQPDFSRVTASSFVLVYPILPIMVLIVMSFASDFRAPMLLALVATLASVSDAGAFFVGCRLGRHKLCPKISPKKTVEGSIGALAAGAVCGIAWGLIAQKLGYFEIELIHYIILGVLCGAFSQLGDLSASMLKRFCGVKDFGTYIPGHGGIMDRCDSILACTAIVFVYIRLFAAELL